MQQIINTNRAIIPCSRETLMEQWLKLTRELHGLADSEIMLAAKFLEKRLELKSKILDEDLLDEFLQSTKIRKAIRDEADIKNSAVFQNMMTSLRKKGFFIDGDKINKAFIPNINDPSKNFFKVEIIFKIDG